MMLTLHEQLWKYCYKNKQTDDLSVQKYELASELTSYIYLRTVYRYVTLRFSRDRNSSFQTLLINTVVQHDYINADFDRKFYP